MNNLRTSPLSSCKNLPPPIFFMVHLLHRLYGVDAPGQKHHSQKISQSLDMRFLDTLLHKRRGRHTNYKYIHKLYTRMYLQSTSNRKTNTIQNAILTRTRKLV